MNTAGPLSSIIRIKVLRPVSACQPYYGHIILFRRVYRLQAMGIRHSVASQLARWPSYGAPSRMLSIRYGIQVVSTTAILCVLANRIRGLLSPTWKPSTRGLRLVLSHTARDPDPPVCSRPSPDRQASGNRYGCQGNLLPGPISRTPIAQPSSGMYPVFSVS